PFVSQDVLGVLQVVRPREIACGKSIGGYRGPEDRSDAEAETDKGSSAARLGSCAELSIRNAIPPGAESRDLRNVHLHGASQAGALESSICRRGHTHPRIVRPSGQGCEGPDRADASETRYDPSRIRGGARTAG